MIYKTFEPDPDLSRFVKCYWTLEAEKQPINEKQRIVPDGCMEMIFHYGDLYIQYLPDNTAIEQPRCFVFGQITQPLDIEPIGNTGIIAARFHPGGFAPFSALPLDVMENRAVPLLEVFGDKGTQLEQDVLEAGNNEERIKLIETFLGNVHIDTVYADAAIRSCVDTLLRLNGEIGVNDLSEQMNIHRRQLERRFAATVGLSPKQLSKILRLQTALKLLSGKKYNNLTSLALEANYYDQAHFIKDFKEFTSVSPKNFYAGNLKMSALFIDEEQER